MIPESRTAGTIAAIWQVDESISTTNLRRDRSNHKHKSRLDSGKAEDDSACADFGGVWKNDNLRIIHGRASGSGKGWQLPCGNGAALEGSNVQPHRQAQLRNGLRAISQARTPILIHRALEAAADRLVAQASSRR